MLILSRFDRWSISYKHFRAITVRDLFPFGRDNGDDSLYAGTAAGGAEDVSSAEVPLATNVRFFGRDYGAIYVSFGLSSQSVGYDQN